MVKQIIPFQPNLKKTFKKDHPEQDYLNISEFYYNTVQGEGIYIGQPAAFLRLQGCTLSCKYCDSKEVWRTGNPYTFEELFRLIEESDLREQLYNGQHLVLTGGSPLLQQYQIADFLWEFEMQYGFLPFVEIENECVIIPIPKIIGKVKCWNNSPKLSSCDMGAKHYYKPEAILKLSELENSWFKIVISREEDWEEIEEYFLGCNLIKKEQIILMPEGATRAELEKSRMLTVEMAIEHGVRYSDRLHIQIWNKKVGC